MIAAEGSSLRSALPALAHMRRMHGARRAAAARWPLRAARPLARPPACCRRARARQVPPHLLTREPPTSRQGDDPPILPLPLLLPTQDEELSELVAGRPNSDIPALLPHLFLRLDQRLADPASRPELYHLASSSQPYAEAGELLLAGGGEGMAVAAGTQHHSHLYGRWAGPAAGRAQAVHLGRGVVRSSPAAASAASPL